MRVAVAALSLLLAAITAGVGWMKVPAESQICVLGYCRFDQLYARIDAAGANLGNVAALLNADPSNPATWCAYAELLAQNGDNARAEAAFARAIELGPGMSPVLMRAANFHVARGRWAQALPLFQRMLAQTGAFDQVVFSYMLRSGVAIPQLLAAAMPDESRPAGAWLAWIGRNGIDQDVLETWAWMREHKLGNQKLAIEAVWKLWDRKSFAAAQQLWADWIGPAGEYPERERLFNTGFDTDPVATPFDWKLEAPASVELMRREGLELRFRGIENVNFSQVHQFATVEAGRYRFAAEIEANGLTTEQRPFFHIFDAEPVRKVEVQTKQVPGDASRSWITLEFEVPVGTRAVEVGLERRAADRGEGRIAGMLHVYRVSLVRL